jgi:hypothetical protein
MKYEYKTVTGYWSDEADRIFTVKVALKSWDGYNDTDDEQIFYYMDGEPLIVGCTISEGFVVTNIEEV